MKIEHNYLIFSTGKKRYAFLGIVGLSPKLVISEGFDGSFDDDEFTLEEKRELVDYMIDSWQRYKLNLNSLEKKIDNQ